MTMDAVRRLVVDLQNLASKARDAVALEEIEAAKQALDAVKVNATAAILGDLKSLAANTCNVRRRCASTPSPQRH